MFKILCDSRNESCEIYVLKCQDLNNKGICDIEAKFVCRLFKSVKSNNSKHAYCCGAVPNSTVDVDCF